MVESLLPRLRSMCSRKRLPPGAELDDLVHEAALRLQTAVRKWDPERLSLERWAVGCLRRCVVEACRSLWPGSTHLVRSNGAVCREQARLRNSLGRTPVLAELADALGRRPDTVQRWSTGVSHVPLDEGFDLVGPSPEGALDQRNLLRRLRAALLAENAEWLVQVFDDDGVRDRALDLQCSERTVRRQRARALARVRERMRGER